MKNTNDLTRRFLPNDFSISNWDSISPYFEELLSRELNSLQDLESWLKDKSELDAFLEEDMAWRYIKMNIDTRDPLLQERFNFFVQEINPRIAPINNQLERKLLASKHRNELDHSKYFILIRGIQKSVELFREKNIPILTRLEQKSQEFGAISAAMSVVIEGQKMTLQRAAKLFEETDRSLRQKAFEKISTRRLQDKDRLNQLYSELIKDRNQVAINADYSNYRDYMFDALGRFDYSPQDCFDFHESIEKVVMPYIIDIDIERKKQLGLSELRPWDKSVDLTGKAPLIPFKDSVELVKKSIEVFDQLDPFFGDCLKTMDQLGYLDLESKEGKAPGGFNYPLYESGIPFIYMNAVGTFRDMVTMMHEGGHAIHSFLMAKLELVDFQNTPSEVAELASMSMELMSMDHWDVFFENQEDLNRAKKEQLIGVLTTLPWVATIDEFQHWVYENPTHSIDERTENWNRINAKFSSPITDWTGWEEARNNAWQRQLHLYEVPFYYIEYGMAQLGAIAVWRNYRTNPKKGLEQYQAALKLGYTKSIGEIYEAAGIKFDFSKEYVKELIEFVINELKSID
ncbi:M3 family oligoendopeptidase [Acidiluteibacter ferrifornacis]|uniref:M3 family oligoendopeptidase n=1 Tax=Acidiluteibacter ferrifornacis TaxID=2692424 RepID=A0A6N9NH47_9FLAO|nr:M3 family oligoendopeptidase [Acidiluteibacter ferrifornacis]NBG65988.1 M3 family oligoendopeptidase [Acidiluteibacter ferrifornacis]